jgi:hypothetical protein
MWRIWCKSLGEKASHKNDEADKVAIIRTVIFATYLITNAFIIAGVVRHWNGKNINIEIEIYENPNNSKNSYPEKWYNLGVGRDTTVESIYSTTNFD